MTRLEDDLRETYRRNAPAEHELVPLTWDVPAGNRAKSRWRLPALAAACVALLVLGIGFVARNGPHSSSPPVGVPGPTTGGSITPTPAPAVSVYGTKTESYRGIAITVPGDLEKNAWNCGMQSAPTLIVGPMPTGCVEPASGVSDATLIRMLPSESAAGRVLVARAKTPVTVDGVQAYTSCATCTSEDIANGTFTEDDGSILYFPVQKVVIDAYTSMIGRTPDKVLHTARVL